MISESINGLRVEIDGNAIIVHAEDVEGSDRVAELNRALFAIKTIKAKIEADPFRTVRYRVWVQAASGSLMSVSETKQAITYIQPYMRFSGEEPPYIRD